MKILSALLLMMTTALAQTVPNNATINVTGSHQNITINQTGSGHSVSVTSTGDNVPVSVTQSGTPKNFSITINCVSNCATEPYIINQY